MNHQRIPQDVDPRIKNTILILIGILFVVMAKLLVGCQKESSFTSREKPVIESDKHLMPLGGYNLTKRVWTPELEAASRRGGVKGKPTKPPKDTTVVQPPTDTTGNDNPPPPPPPPTGGKVIYLDFDGHYMAGTAWNVNGPVTCKYSGMTETEIQATIARVQADYSEFDVTVTGDSTLYWAADPRKRMRVVITESWEWYSQAGGVAYIGSFTWGDNTPCFVFSSLLGYNGKYIADAISHEAGHTLGNRHQSKYTWDAIANAWIKEAEYNPDMAADGKGYLMGYPYPHESGWQVGRNSAGVIQDDRAIIQATLAR
jgi:hypothetical protein